MRPRSILFVLLLLILVGCGEEVPVPESVAPTPVPSPLQPTPTLAPTRELEPMIVTLELWLPEELDPYGGGPGADLFAQQLDDFSDVYPDVQVEVLVKKAHGRGGLLDFLRTARDAAPSILPDLVVLDAGELETAARSGLIQPLDDILSPAEMADRFLFSIGLGTVDEQTLGFVVGADMQHLVYRPDRFESPPVSWTEIISPPVPFLFPVGTRSQSVSDATLIQYLAAGGKLTGEDGGPWLDESVMVSVLGFYSACVSTGTISPTVVFRTRDAGQAWEQFQNGEGEIAVVPASRFWLEADETVAAAAIPTQSGQPLSIAQGWALGMVTDDPVRQSLAVLLLDWLIAPDHNGQWTQAAGYLPGTQGALRIWDVSNAGRAVLRSLMEAAVPPPRPEVIAVVGPAMQEAVDSVLRGWATPEEAAAAAVKRLEE